MDAQIFSIGTEILLGNIVDTNSKYLAEQFMALGINVYKMETLGDNFNRLVSAFKNIDGKVDFVISTGGLGPTPDDITKEAMIEAVGLSDQATVDENSYKDLLDYFNGKQEKADANIKQAIFPKSAIVLRNTVGTAPGMVLESSKGTKFVCLPGPPNEMVIMFEDELIKYLPKDAYMKSIFVKIGLMGESEMAGKISLDRDKPTISPYVNDQGPFLRITARDISEKEVNRQLEEGLTDVKKTFADYIITSDDIRKEQVLINLLKERKEFVASGESVTGGLIASSIIDISGASEVLKESYIVYSNEAKEKILNVSRETIKEYTVVSKEVLSQMLDGLYSISKVNLAIATTGFAHTGEVYLGMLYNGKKYMKHLQFNGDRNRVRLRTKNYAMDMAILIMRGVYEDNISF